MRQRDGFEEDIVEKRRDWGAEGREEEVWRGGGAEVLRHVGTAEQDSLLERGRRRTARWRRWRTPGGRTAADVAT